MGTIFAPSLRVEVTAAAYARPTMGSKVAPNGTSDNHTVSKPMASISVRSAANPSRSPAPTPAETANRIFMNPCQVPA